jgi:8-oxo-dGTP diphosphatase
MTGLIIGVLQEELIIFKHISIGVAMLKIDVVAAIIYKDNTILCVQRNNQGEIALKWEFPGGKLEEGETHEEALIREIKEELDCEITVDDFMMTVNYQYKTFHLNMYCYKCTLVSDKITLQEHIDSKWLKIEDLPMLDWAPADLPVVRKLVKENHETRTI